MKRTLFTTTILLSFLSSCQKETSSVQKEAEPIVFTACIAESADTKVSVDCNDGKVSWVAGDSILISNGTVTKTYTADKRGATTTFTVKESSKPAFTEAAQYSATYGTMPTPGAAQQYSATPGALVYMEAPETESTSTPKFTFEVKCGLLKLNLTAAGKSVKRISVSDGTNTYSLVCETAQSIESATDFYIALPAGTYTKYIIRDSEGYEAVKTAKSFGTEVASNQINKVTFSALNFAAPKYTEGVYTGDGIKIGSIWWAPVNCGYDADHLCGKLYQWGRMDGSGYYKDATATVPAQDASDKVIQTNSVDLGGSNGSPYTTSNPAADTFYKNPNTDTYDWYTSSTSALFSSWPMTAPSGTSRIGNPCPAGWRVPTSDEMGNLVYSDWNSSTQKGNTKRTITFSSGYGTINGLTLPAAGYRKDDGSFSNRSSQGFYW